jgi:hypothetical protein
MELIHETPNYNYMILSTIGHRPPLIGAHHTPVVGVAFEGRLYSSMTSRVRP